MANRIEELATKRMRWLTDESVSMSIAERRELSRLCKTAAPDLRFVDRRFPVAPPGRVVSKVLVKRNASELRRVFR